MKFSKLLLLEDSPLVFCTCSFFFLLCMYANTHSLFMQRIWLVHARLLVIEKGDTTRSRKVAQRVKHFLCEREYLSSNPENPWKAKHNNVWPQSCCFYSKRRWEQGPLQKLRELASLVCASAYNKENLSQTKWNACTHTYEIHTSYTHKERSPLYEGKLLYINMEKRQSS